MSVKIRFSRTGKSHQLSYRIVATDKNSKRDGRFLEILGFYNPHNKPPQNIKVKRERLDYWTSKGAQLTPAVAKLLSPNMPSSGSQKLKEKKPKNSTRLPNHPT